jgi:hypothetical protein
MDGYDIEKASLRLGVAESFDSIDLFNRHFHGDKISAAIRPLICLAGAKTHEEH